MAMGNSLRSVPVAIFIYSIPNPKPRADERFRYDFVLYEWLGWQDSVRSGSLIAPTPRTADSFVHSHSGLRSAAATRVLHLRSWALYLTAGVGPHPARCTGIGYRSTLLNPILTLRKHDAHPGDAPQRLMVRTGTLDAFSELVLHRHSLRSPLFSLRSGVSVLFALDTLLPLSPFYAPLPSLHRSSTSPEHKIQPREVSRPDFDKNISRKRPKFQKRGRPKCDDEPKGTFGFGGTHWRFYRTFRFWESRFLGALCRAVGGSFG